MDNMVIKVQMRELAIPQLTFQAMLQANLEIQNLDSTLMCVQLHLSSTMEIEISKSV